MPPEDNKNRYSLRKLQGNDIYLMAVTGESINVPSGSSGEYKVDLYVGPKDQAVLKDMAEYLDLTIDYGFLWMLAPCKSSWRLFSNVITNAGIYCSLLGFV